MPFPVNQKTTMQDEELSHHAELECFSFCAVKHSPRNTCTAGKVQVHQNHFHQKKFFIKMPLSSKCHFHQKPLSSKTTFIKNHFHQKPFSSETTFIKNHFHQKPISSKTNFIRALPVRGTHHPSKNNTVRVCVKASRAEGPRRLHTNTACAQGFGFRVQVFGVQVFRV